MYRIMRFLLVVTVLLLLYLVALTVYFIPQLGFVLVGLVLWRVSKKGFQYSAHGTARWAGNDDIQHMIGGGGLPVGHFQDRVSAHSGVKALFSWRLPAADACRKFFISLKRKQPKELLRLNDAVHTCVFAPTGTGKGVAVAIPFLLTCPDSMVVVDFKGELAAATAEARRAMGHHVVALDPYRVFTKNPDTYNAIESLDRHSLTLLDDARDLAEALVVRTGQEKEPHWNDSAELWIAAMIAMVATFAEGDDRSLQSVRTLLTNPERMQAAIKLMCESDEMDGMLSRIGFQLTHFKDKELASALTTTNRFMRFLDTTAISENTRQSSFDPADLVKKKMTIYLILPPDRMRAQNGLLRMWISSMLRAVVKGGLQEKHKVHFLLDEAASLGHMEALDDAVDKLRGYGVRLIFMWQSIAQLRKCFPDGQDQTLLSNVTQVFFAVNDQQTAEYVSARLGESTIVVNSGGTGRGTGTSSQSHGQGNSSSRSWNSNQNWQFLGRKLLKPEEVTALPPRVAITFTPGVPPVPTCLVRYYEKDFKVPRRFGPIKVAFETACLFIAVGILAVIFTGGFLRHALDQTASPIVAPVHQEIPIPVQFPPASGQ